MFGVDDLLIGGLIGGVGSLVSGMFNSENVEKTNTQNLQIARETNQMSMEEAQRNRDYQERLSNSAYQRSMKDMYAAGLNPILAYQKGGASTPSGGQAAFTTPKMEAPHMPNVIGEAVNTAMAYKRAAQENENMRYTADNIQADTAKKISEENINKAKLQILGEELSPAQLCKIIAEQDKSVYQTSAGAAARKAGTLATEAERTVAPVLNSAKSIAQTISPFKSYEVTRSGSRWNRFGEENHYQDTTFHNRWPH